MKMPIITKRGRAGLMKIRVQYMIIKFERFPSSIGNAELKGWNRTRSESALEAEVVRL